MTTVNINSPFGFSTFCDDIRYEINGKTSFIGAYKGKMLIHGPAPWILPKFCINVTCVFPLLDINVERSDLKIEVLFPGVPDGSETQKKVLPTKGILWGEGAQIRKFEDPDIQPVMGFEYAFVFTPFVLTVAGSIKVRGTIDGKTYRFGGLEVIEALPSMQNSAA